MVLGFGVAVDREIVWDAVVLGNLAQHHGIRPEELVQGAPICTERDLVVSVLGYLRRGAGGERRVDEPEVITAFCGRFEGVTSLGGTAFRAASAMKRLGTRSTVHLSVVDDVVTALLPEGTDYLVGDTEEPTYPHLIVQYPVGARVRTDHLDLVAPRANRLIYVNDPANERLAISAELSEAVSGASVFLISGLNAIRTVPEVTARLDRIEAAIACAGEGTLVFYEDAGFHEPDLAEVVRSRIVPLVDVYSLSDEELEDVLGRPVDLLDAAAVLTAVDVVAARVAVPVLVVHSRHWALAIGAAAVDVVPALATGVALATTRYAFGSAPQAADLASVRAAVVDPTTAAFVDALMVLGSDTTSAVPGGRQVAAVGVPSLDVDSPTTVGLGDTFVGGFLAECAMQLAIRLAASRRVS